MIPAAMNSAPLVYTGAEVCRLANIAMMGFKIVSKFSRPVCSGGTHSHDTENTIRASRQRVARPPIFCGEDLGRVSV